MRVLLDLCVDLKNGELLHQAAREFDVLLTVDRGFSHQQNQATLPIAVIAIMAANNRLETLIRYVPRIEAGLSNIGRRQLVVIPEQ